MSNPFITAETKVVDVLDYGQGYDNEIAEVFKAFKMFRDGYYGLVGFGENWWEVFNQGTEFDEIMGEHWEKIKSEQLMLYIETMAIAMAGTYIRFDEFAETVILASEEGKGFRKEVERKEE